MCAPPMGLKPITLAENERLEGPAMLNRIFVYKSHAYRRAEDLEAKEHVSESQAERLSVFFPLPRMVYRVLFGGRSRLTTDSVEVRKLTKNHPEATVEVIPVR